MKGGRVVFFSYLKTSHVIFPRGPKDPITFWEWEHGTWIHCVSEVIVHPNHPLTFGDWIHRDWHFSAESGGMSLLDLSCICKIWLCACTNTPYSCKNARLPQSQTWRMGPSKTNLLYTTAIFHFHEYGRRGMRVCFIFPKGSHRYTRKVGGMSFSWKKNIAILPSWGVKNST